MFSTLAGNPDMFFRCSNRKLEKLQNKILNTQRVRLKKFKKLSIHVTQKLTHNCYCYSKVGPQTLLKN